MNPLKEFNTILEKIESQSKIMDVLIKQAQSACENAITWYEQQLSELEQ